MARNDGKNKFYRTLDLDKDTKKLISWFHKTSEQLKNDEIDHDFSSSDQ